jgi:hypothetical protein
MGARGGSSVTSDVDAGKHSIVESLAAAASEFSANSKEGTAQIQQPEEEAQSMSVHSESMGGSKQGSEVVTVEDVDEDEESSEEEEYVIM